MSSATARSRSRRPGRAERWGTPSALPPSERRASRRDQTARRRLATDRRTGFQQPGPRNGGSGDAHSRPRPAGLWRSEEHTSELQSLLRISYAVFCLKKKIKHIIKHRSLIDTEVTLYNNR